MKDNYITAIYFKSNNPSAIYNLQKSDGFERVIYHSHFSETALDAFKFGENLIKSESYIESINAKKDSLRFRTFELGVQSYNLN
jgi:hypothetical protein